MSQAVDRKSMTKIPSNSQTDLPSLDEVVKGVISLGGDVESSVVGDTDHQLRRLIQTLRNRKRRFALIFVVCNEQPLRKVLVREVKEALPDQELVETQVTRDDSGLLDKLLKIPGAPEPLFVYGIETLLPSAESEKLRREETLQELQLRREQFRKLNRPLVLWMPEYVYVLIGQHAVDFWSWQSGTFFFTTLQSRKVGIRENTEDRLGPEIGLISNELNEITAESLEEHHEAILNTALRAEQTRLAQVMSPPSDFTGRKAELNELRKAVHLGYKTVLIQGVAGVGKTALALELAGELRKQYYDGNIYVNLKGSTKESLKPADVMWHVVRSLEPGLIRREQSDLPGLYHSMLTDKRVLLCYDDASSEQVESLLPPKDSFLLVTSRPNISLTDGYPTTLAQMSATDAEALVRRIRHDGSRDAADVAAQCGYLPLALRPVASALRQTDWSRMLSILAKAKDEKYNDTIGACLNVAYGLLDKQLRERWRTLAVFPDTFDVAAATVLWRTDASDGKHSLAELRNLGLIEGTNEGLRFGLHEVVRVFADSQMTFDERQEASFRHASYYLHVLTITAALYTKEEYMAAGHSLFDAEEANISAGQQWSANHTEDELSARLCLEYANAGRYALAYRKDPKDLIRWQEDGLRAATSLSDQKRQASQLGFLGWNYAQLGEPRKAIENYQKALIIARETGQRQAEELMLGDIGIIYNRLGEFARAIEYYEQSLAIARELNDKNGEEAVLASLGNAYLKLGDAKTAIEYLNQSLSIARELGDRVKECIDLRNLGNAYLELGEFARAIAYYEQSLAIAQEIGDRRAEATMRGSLGDAFSHEGRIEEAIESYQRGLYLARESQDRHLESLILGRLGDVYFSAGRLREAIEIYQEGHRIAQELGNRNSQGNSLLRLGSAYQDLGDNNTALAFMEQAVEILEEINSPNAPRARQMFSRLKGETSDRAPN